MWYSQAFINSHGNTERFFMNPKRLQLREISSFCVLVCSFKYFIAESVYGHIFIKLPTT